MSIQRGLHLNWAVLEGTIPDSSSHGDEVNNTEDMGGMTPLHWTCVKHLYCPPSEENDNLTLMKWLIESGADPNIMTKALGYTPLHILSLGPGAEEKEISSIWTFIREKYQDRPPTDKDLDQAIRSAVQVLLNGGAKILRSRTHNLTPLSLYLIRCNKDWMAIEHVLKVFPAGITIRDVLELSTLKLCISKKSQELLKFLALTTKHGCRYVRKLEWNISLVEQDRDLTILVLTNEMFDGKLVPDYIPLILPIGEKCKNEIFPLENMELLDHIRDVIGINRRFGLEGVLAAVNLLICEESMYISSEEMTIIFSDTILKFANEVNLEFIQEILYCYVHTSANRYGIDVGSKGMNYVGMGCVMILLEWLAVRRDDKQSVKEITNYLVSKYKMEHILHYIIGVIGKKTNLEIRSEQSAKLTNFDWEDHLETIFELLETQINVIDCNGNTCLHVAIMHSDLSLMSQLMEHNAYPYAKDINGNSCIALTRSILDDAIINIDYLSKKLAIIDATPPMLKVICAETIIQSGLWTGQTSLPASARSILALHGYQTENVSSPPAQPPLLSPSHVPSYDPVSSV